MRAAKSPDASRSFAFTLLSHGTITIGAYLAAFTRSERYHVMYFIIVVILITAAVLNVPVVGNSAIESAP